MATALGQGLPHDEEDDRTDDSSIRPMPPITTMKITKAFQSLTLNAVAGEMRATSLSRTAT